MPDSETPVEPVVSGQNDPNVLDASSLRPDESLAGRDLSGKKLVGDFSRRDFVGANLCQANLDDIVLCRAIMRLCDLKGASMRRVDASRCDFRGACLVGVAVHGTRLRRSNFERTRAAGMWSYGDKPPEVRPLEDGSMPPMEPLDAMDEAAKIWSNEKAKQVDAAKETEEDAKDEAAWEAQKAPLGTKDVVDMQHMNAR